MDEPVNAVWVKFCCVSNIAMLLPGVSSLQRGGVADLLLDAVVRLWTQPNREQLGAATNRRTLWDEATRAAPRTLPSVQQRETNDTSNKDTA